MISFFLLKRRQPSFVNIFWRGDELSWFFLWIFELPKKKIARVKKCTAFFIDMIILQFFCLMFHFTVCLLHCSCIYSTVCLLHGRMEGDSRNRALLCALVSILLHKDFHSDRFLHILVYFCTHPVQSLQINVYFENHTQP